MELQREFKSVFFIYNKVNNSVLIYLLIYLYVSVFWPYFISYELCFGFILNQICCYLLQVCYLTK